MCSGAFGGKISLEGAKDRPSLAVVGTGLLMGPAEALRRKNERARTICKNTSMLIVFARNMLVETSGKFEDSYR